MAETFTKSSTSTAGALDPKKYTGPVTKMSADAFHKKLLSFGPEGPPPDWDPRGLELDESSIGPRKTMRGTGFPDEDVSWGDYDMMPTSYEPEPEPDFRRDSYTGEMTEMPGLREGDGKGGVVVNYCHQSMQVCPLQVCPFLVKEFLTLLQGIIKLLEISPQIVMVYIKRAA